MLSVGLVQFVLPEEQQGCMTTKSVAMLSNTRTLTKLSVFGHCQCWEDYFGNVVGYNYKLPC